MLRLSLLKKKENGQLEWRSSLRDDNRSLFKQINTETENAIRHIRNLVKGEIVKTEYRPKGIKLTDKIVLAKIILALGEGEYSYDKLPVLDLKGKYGWTGYIAFLEPDDLQYPIMKGTDKHGRPFIAFKLKDTKTGKVFVETLFQRYMNKDFSNIWANGGISHEIEVFGGIIVKLSQTNVYSRIKSLAAGDIIQVKSYSVKLATPPEPSAEWDRDAVNLYFWHGW